MGRSGSRIDRGEELILGGDEEEKHLSMVMKAEGSVEDAEAWLDDAGGVATYSSCGVSGGSVVGRKKNIVALCCYCRLSVRR